MSRTCKRCGKMFSNTGKHSKICQRCSRSIIKGEVTERSLLRNIKEEAKKNDYAAASYHLIRLYELYKGGKAK